MSTDADVRIAKKLCGVVRDVRIEAEVCRASPLPGDRGFDAITGNRTRKYYFCQTINTGDCPHFEEKPDAP